MVGTVGDRPSGCEGAGGDGSVQGRGAVGDKVFGTEDRVYNVAH